VTAGARGDGVAELIDMILADDVRLSCGNS
jgi:hypothetical protein